MSGLTSEEIKDKFIGALLGTHVGDALGMPFEGKSCDEMESRYGIVREMTDGFRGKGSYTDDTEMMMAVAESLIEKKGFDGTHMSGKFIEKYHPSRGYGWGTRLTISLMKQGVSWDKVGDFVYESGSFGNGSAMRIAPVGLFYFDNLQELKKVSYASSRITHSHPLGMEGAALQANAIALALSSDPKEEFDPREFVLRLMESISPETPFYLGSLKQIAYLLDQNPSRREVVDILGNNATATHSVPTAIYCFLANHQSFEEALVCAINLGGDSDTIGAMTGAVAGAYQGKKAIPERWLNLLEKRDYVEALASRLYSVQCTV